MTKKTCWAITDDKIGNQVQAQGLASAVDFQSTVKIISLKQPWRSLPPAIWPPGILGTDQGASLLFEPWPDLIISCGRQAVGVAVEIKRRAKDKTIAVHIQHPHVSVSNFDLIAAPAHDNLKGPNVMPTFGALGRINRKILDEAALKFTNYPRPLIAASIGGSNGVYRLGERQANEIAHLLNKVATDTGGSLLITTSRRTGPENEIILRNALKDTSGEFWDGVGCNPYLSYLGSADYIVVTGDSVNMLSEACTTGKPVYVIHLQASRKTKFTRFHQELEKSGLVRPFTGQLESWQCEPLDETARVAARIHQIMS